MRCGALLVATFVVAAACDLHAVSQVDDERAAAGVAPVVLSDLLSEQATARSAAMCAAGTDAPSVDPIGDFDAETVSAVDDLAGSAPLDLTIADPIQRNIVATRAILDAWVGDPIVVDPRWDEIGVGETTCPDGRLYLSTALTQAPSLQASGRYATPIFSSAQITRTSNLEYGTAVNHAGQTVDLYLDLFTPPSGPTPTRPAVLLFHGGGFVGGTRQDYAQGALDVARLGYVAATVSYRLRPSGSSTLAAAADAIDDGMEAVRWLKANAATYGIDTTRIGALGQSAGGVIALGLALADDQTPGGPLAAHSPTIHGAVSAGGHLTPGLSILNLRAAQPAVQMFNYEIDPTAGDASEAIKTCQAVRRSGNTCDFNQMPGEGHLSWITPGGPLWTAEVGPFLYRHLRLG